MKVKLDVGQISYAVMRSVSIPGGNGKCVYCIIHNCIVSIDSRGNKVEQDRPFVADSEHRQSVKTINAEPQKLMRQQKQMKKLTVEYCTAEQDRNVVGGILQRNHIVQFELETKSGSKTFANFSIQHFLDLTICKLKDFIHAQRFNGRVFQESKLAGYSGNLKKTMYRNETAGSVESDCSPVEPCLVWLAWNICSQTIVLKPLTLYLTKLRLVFDT